MRSKKNTLKILLDTTFILPTLGIDVGEEVEKCIERLGKTKAELYYSRFSILESLWIAARLIRDKSFDMERFRQGLRSVTRSGKYIVIEEDDRVFEEALKLYGLGHRDMMDNILYASSAVLGLKLLSVDTELKEFIQSKGLEDTIISPSQIIHETKK